VTDKHSPLAIHRLLDEAFAGIDMTPDVQDLKEEMRANLVARAAELQGSGVSAADAAQRAIAEQGDVRSVIEDTATASADAAPWGQRVRPNPGYVVRTVVLGLTAAAALAGMVLAVVFPDLALWVQVVSGLALAATAGVIVADALRQETTTNYPVPRQRAIGYGIAAAAAMAGAAAAAVGVPDLSVPWLVGGGLAVVAAVIGFTYLGATQTNRHKPWVVRMQSHHRLTEFELAGDRFSQDPAAAARFGLYTVVNWLLAGAGFVVLGLTVGWGWSWLALLAGIVTMMIMLARMLFEPQRSDAAMPQPRRG
jgi:hypothetical protein